MHWYGLLSAAKYTILQRKLDILLVQCRRQMQHTNEELQCSLCLSCTHIAHLADILAARESLMNARLIYHSIKQSLPLEMLFAAYAVDATTLQVCVCARACVPIVFQRHFHALYQACEQAFRLLHAEMESRAHGAAKVETHLKSPVTAAPVQLYHPLLATVSATQSQHASSTAHEYVCARTHSRCARAHLQVDFARIDSCR